MPTGTLLAAGMVFLAVTLGTVAFALFVEWARERRRGANMVKQLRQLAQEGPTDAASETLLRRGARQRALDPVLAHLPHTRDVKLMLQQGGVGMSLQSYVALTLGLAVGLTLGTWLISRLWLVALPAGVFGALLPFLVIRRRAKKRISKFESQLPDAIDLIGRAIRAGHPLSAGLKMVADETDEPIAGEFARVFEEQRFGLPFNDTLFSLADRIRLMDVRILNTAILIQREVGGNLAEVLDNLAYTIRQRFKLRRQLRVITAQGRLSGYVLAVLPIAVGFVIFLLNPSYILTLFREPIGRFMVAAAFLLQLMGYLWIRKIVDVEL